MSKPNATATASVDTALLAIVLFVLGWWVLDFGAQWLDRAYPLERDTKCMTDTRPDFDLYEETR